MKPLFSRFLTMLENVNRLVEKGLAEGFITEHEVLQPYLIY
ncbi:hypothetical protein [Salipaludibacillus sp. LMS25]|nr:hypothetical protein [Salipaludibacillus sp. LMS25]